MWTNVFRIGGLNQISWFQFLPNESDLGSLPDRSLKVEQKDTATWLVLSSHMQLQKEGFLSTWTNSFVGPWDPSQGLHNPDEKIKLWLFLPGHHSSVVEGAQGAVSRLAVVANGVWVAPGDSEEVAAALSQSLRNCIEKALIKLSYVRFGDVFSKHYPGHVEGLFRRGQPTFEFIFAATEEAIFVHVVISAKHIRTISSGDVERLLMRSSKSPGYRLPVIVSPHGMRGWLTGCCPNDLLKQVYFSNAMPRTENGFLGLPSHVSQHPSCQLRGQNCYVEVTIGCHRLENDKALNSNLNSMRNLPKSDVVESLDVGRSDQKDSINHSSIHEKAFIYPVEAVLVPVLQASSARSSMKRFWLQNWMGPSLPGSSFLMHWGYDSMEASLIEANGLSSQHGCNSSSNSNNSSISSLTSSSSESDNKMIAKTGDLEADADSLSCRHSSLSIDQLEIDGHKLGAKRPRSGMTQSLGQVGKEKNEMTYGDYKFKSVFGSIDISNSGITGTANDHIGSNLDWDDDDRGMGMDIQALLSEFGDFGDFFENDILPFGEPPGTAESQFMFSAPDCGEVGSSPIGMEVVDQMILPSGFPSFESLNPPVAASSTDECISKNQELAQDALTSGPMNYTPSHDPGEFDHIIKAEAQMNFAAEYGAIETPIGELSSTIFRSPYCPKSRRVESSSSGTSHYRYGAAPPPSSPSSDGVGNKNDILVNAKMDRGRHDKKKYYTFVENGKEQYAKGSFVHNEKHIGSEGKLSSPFPASNSVNAVNNVRRSTLSLENILLTMKTVLATEVECTMFQSFMCRIRHILFSSSNPRPISLSRLSASSYVSQLPCDASTMTDNVSSLYEMKKKEAIPVRIAGDIGVGMLDGRLNAPVGVWRPVSGPKVMKPMNSPSVEISPSLSHHSFNEDGMLSYGQRQPLLELLDAMALLVQQATSLVDVALDGDCGDGPYGWLALQEQWRRGFCCGPSMVHAGCGGTLASAHSLDIAGIELVDPLSSEIHASSVISLLQSDIKTALKHAFGNLDGPLAVIDWCRGWSMAGDGAIDSTLSDYTDSSSAVTGEPISPAQSSVTGSSSLKVDGAKIDETTHRRSNQDVESEQRLNLRQKPKVFILPLPSILVGQSIVIHPKCFTETGFTGRGESVYSYQDDWLKTSAKSLQFWEKAPFEPYASPKPINYYVVSPDIDPLTSAAVDFFQQLGTVYETCKLGTHSPMTLDKQMEIDMGKYSSSGFVLLDCPQSMKIESSNSSLLGSISDYFLSLSNGWDLMSYLKSLSKAIKALKVSPSLTTNPKEGYSGPCTVIYVVCPFPEPVAVLQTIIQASAAVGSNVFSSDRERRSLLHNQVGKALSCSAAVDEASVSNVVTISGFSMPKLVLQIVTVDAIFRVTSPALNELMILKETAFTVYNKARRISKACPNDVASSSSVSCRSPVLTQMPPIPTMWKDCVGSRITGSSLTREGEIDASLRTGTWDNSWQTRTGGLASDPSRNGDITPLVDSRYMFEPLFILSEAGSLEHAVTPPAFGNLASESSKLSDINGAFIQNTSATGAGDSGSSSQIDGSEPESLGSSYQKTLPTIHCCYGWTEDWRWLVCIWTDARGELLDSHIFPFGGISSRQDTKGLQCLFVQILQQGCQILQASCSTEVGTVKPRDFVITRIGSFFELEYLEWQKAIVSIGGSDLKKWTLQLRRSSPDGVPASGNGASLQEQEMSLIQERTIPSSPSPLYNPLSKASGFMKGSLGQTSGRKQLMGGTMIDNSKGMLQWVQSITFAAISIDHSLHFVCQADTASPGGTQGGSNNVGQTGYLEGFTPVKSLGSTDASYILIPSPNMCFLPPTPLQLPTCLTAESPPLAHLLHSKGSAIPLSTGFVVSKAVPSMRKDYRNSGRDEWPSVLSVSLVDYYGSHVNGQEKMVRGTMKHVGRPPESEARDFKPRTQLILEGIAAELHALSWMTVSPAYLERRTALPFHCDMVLRLRRLLHFADKEFSQQDKLLV